MRAVDSAYVWLGDTTKGQAELIAFTHWSRISVQLCQEFRESREDSCDQRIRIFPIELVAHVRHANICFCATEKYISDSLLIQYSITKCTCNKHLHV